MLRINYYERMAVPKDSGLWHVFLPYRPLKNAIQAVWQGIPLLNSHYYSPCTLIVNIAANARARMIFTLRNTLARL